MEIYIEYALLENFLYDGVLLWLAYYTAKVKGALWKLCLSAGLGAVFAAVYPLLGLPIGVGLVCKIAVGCLLCLMPFPALRARGQMRRYVFTCIVFFAFSFGFGGALLGIYGVTDEKVPSWLVFIGFAVLSASGVCLVKRLYAKRQVYCGCYDCRVQVDDVSVTAVGFYDSGNLAIHKNTPVCFISPAVLYDLIGEKIMKCGGQVCDEMYISTLGGQKRTSLYRGKIEVKTGAGNVSCEVYFAPSKNMIGREYAVLIHARILEG